MSDILKNERLYSISHFLKKNFLFAVFVMIQPLLFERIFCFFRFLESVKKTICAFQIFRALKHTETGTIFAFKSVAQYNLAVMNRHCKIGLVKIASVKNKLVIPDNFSSLCT